jgi:fucose permease
MTVPRSRSERRVRRPSAEGATPWRTRLAIAGAFVVFGVVEASWSSRIPVIRERLGLTDLGLSAALAGPAVGLLIATAMAPAINRRIGSDRMASGSIVAGAAGLVLPALAWNLVTLTVALVLWGTALGVLDLAMNAQGVALERREGRSVMSRLHGSYSVTVLAFAPLGGLATRLGVTPLVHFAVAAVGCIVMTQPIRAAMLPDATSTMPTGLPHSGLARRGQPARTRSTKDLVRLAAIGFCALIAEGSVGNWSGILLHQDDHASLAVAPLALTTFSVGMAIGRWRGDDLITRFGHRAVSRAAALLAALGLAVGAGSTWLDPALVGYAIFGLGLSVLVPIVFAVAGQMSGITPVSAMSRLTMFSYGGLFVGPPLVGLLASVTSLRFALLCVAGLLLAAAAVAHHTVTPAAHRTWGA